MPERIDYISKQQLLDYLENTKLWNDIKDYSEQRDKSTYKNTKLYDFVREMECIKYVKN